MSRYSRASAKSPVPGSHAPYGGERQCRHHVTVNPGARIHRSAQVRRGRRCRHRGRFDGHRQCAESRGSKYPAALFPRRGGPVEALPRSPGTDSDSQWLLSLVVGRAIVVRDAVAPAVGQEPARCEISQDPRSRPAPASVGVSPVRRGNSRVCDRIAKRSQARFEKNSRDLPHRVSERTIRHGDGSEDRTVRHWPALALGRANGTSQPGSARFRPLCQDLSGDSRVTPSGSCGRTALPYR